MIVALLGLVCLLLIANIWYYENRYPRPEKKAKTINLTGERLKEEHRDYGKEA